MISAQDIHNIAKAVVFTAGELATVGKISALYNVNLDAIADRGDIQFGIKIYGNHSNAQERFKIGSDAYRQSLFHECRQLQCQPALIGVCLDFYTNKAYVYFAEELEADWVPFNRMRHVLTTDFHIYNPFFRPAPIIQKELVDNAKIPDTSLMQDV